MGERLADGGRDERAETARDDLDGQKERDLGHAHPSRAVERETAAADDAVNVRMELQLLAPRVEHGGDAECRAKLRLRDVDESAACCAEQDRVNDRRRVDGQHVELLGDGEDGVEVRRWEHLAATGLDPCRSCRTATERTVAVAARVPLRLFVTAGVAAMAMAAESGRAAVRDRAERAELVRRETAGSKQLSGFGPHDRAEGRCVIHRPNACGEG